MLGRNAAKKVVTIRMNDDLSPTIVNEELEKGCVAEVAKLKMFGSLVIDERFMEDMTRLTGMIESECDSRQFMNHLIVTNNAVQSYFYKGDKPGDRTSAFSSSVINTKEGDVVGVTLSSLRNKNVADSNELAIATYLILRELRKDGRIKHEPSLALAYADKSAHSFILLDKEGGDERLQHLLLDTSAPLRLMDKKTKVTSPQLAIFTLTAEQHEKVLKGIECQPTHLYVAVDKDSWVDMSDKRTYGNKKEPKVAR